jgi:N,N'-diacetyllegionaminate synthase
LEYFKSNKNPVYFIAEVGGNHEGDFEYAKHLTNLAIESGADAVKFQLYTGDTLVSKLESPDRNAHFKKFELEREQYIELAELCNTSSVNFMASVWDESMLDWINPYLAIHKVGSGDLTCYPLIYALVRTGKPIILSTGLSNMADIKNVISFIEKLDSSYIHDKKLALLQCTSSYPTPDEDAFQQSFNLPVGFSNHIMGPDAIELSVALGAEIIEAHFTDDRSGKTFRDHNLSLTKDEIINLLPKLARIKKLKGSPEKKLTKSEESSGNHLSFRRSIYAAGNIEEGEIFTELNMTFLRPDHGISASEYYEVLGSVSTKKILKNHPILRSHIANET